MTSVKVPPRSIQKSHFSPIAYPSCPHAAAWLRHNKTNAIRQPAMAGRLIFKLVSGGQAERHVTEHGTVSL
jgi:hypothetical protein